MNLMTLVIPVYNKEKFIKRCFDSIVNQVSGVDKFQVIIVDDGSIDNSGSICDQYGKEYGWEVYHTKNMGVSEARNLGIEKAKGKYVTFLDADDFLAKEAFREMLRYSESNFNIVQFCQYRLRNTKYFDERLLMPYRFNEGVYLIDNIPRYWVYVWNKIYKLDFLNDYKIRFKKGMQFGEDTLFNIQCILANNGLYHSYGATVYHVLDDNNSLCRGDGLNIDRIELLDKEMTKIYDLETDEMKKKWLLEITNQHRRSRLYRKNGFRKGCKGSYDAVYVVKDSSMNPELFYSLRSLDENWQYNDVWLCGGCPDGLYPDHVMKIKQKGLNKWEKVRNMLIDICKNDKITEDFWLFNDDFFVLKPIAEDMLPQFNGVLDKYADYVVKKQGREDQFTLRIRQAYMDLKNAGLTTYNYEVHKPMLLNRQRLLEVLEEFPETPAFRSIYGNYWNIGGQDRHDMKIKVLNFSKMDLVKNYWDFVSTDDTSFMEGEVGRFIRDRFKNESRFERS